MAADAGPVVLEAARAQDLKQVLAQLVHAASHVKLRKSARILGSLPVWHQCPRQNPKGLPRTVLQLRGNASQGQLQHEQRPLL